MKSTLMRALSLSLLLFIAIAAGSLSASAQSQSAAAMQMQQVPAGVQDKTATIYGMKIRYLEAGSGPAVVLLHGLGGDSSNWQANITALAAKYHVFVPDQIGFGKSDKPFINYRVGTLVDFLNALYKEWKIERAAVVGNSLGGFTALAFALAHPEKVDKIVLVDAAGYSVPKDVDPRLFNALNPATREGVRQVMSVIFYNKQLFANDAAVDAFFTRKLQTGDGYTVRAFTESILRNEDVIDGKLDAIKQPTLIIWGREDGLTPLALGERFNKEIKGSQLFVIDKCGHVPQLEKSAEFNAALLKFLEGGNIASK